MRVEFVQRFSTLLREVRRWTRNPLARLRSTPEDSQPFTSLMVSQSACLYPRDFWIRLVEPVFHIPWDLFSFFHIFFKNEDFIVKVFHLYLIPFLRTNNFHGQIFVNPSYMIQFLIRTCTIWLLLRLKFLISHRVRFIC